MKKVILFVAVAAAVSSCNPERRRAQEAADAAMRDYVRQEIRVADMYIRQYNEKMALRKELDGYDYFERKNLDTVKLMKGLEKLKGKKLEKYRQYVERELEMMTAGTR